MCCRAGITELQFYRQFFIKVRLSKIFDIRCDALVAITIVVLVVVVILVIVIVGNGQVQFVSFLDKFLNKRRERSAAEKHCRPYLTL